MTLEPPVLGKRLLVQVARNASGRRDAKLLESAMEPLDFGVINATTAGLFRIRGQVQDEGARFPWSCILKVIHAPEGAQSPKAWNYWRREALVYRSGLLESLPSGLRGPRSFGVVFRRPRQALLFIEEVKGQPVSSISRLLTSALHLGRFNGHFARHPSALPRVDWLCSNFLRSASAERAANAAVLEDPRTWRHPLLRAGLPRSFEPRLRAVWERCDQLLDLVDSAPQTLCHFDAYEPNLFLTKDETGEAETVLIDWGFLGPGGLGVDLGQLLANTFLWLRLPPRRFPQFFTQALGAYLRGLKEAGGQVKIRQLEETVRASAALRAGLYAPFLLRVLLDAGQHDYWRDQFHASVNATLRPWGQAMSALFALAQLRPDGRMV